jgi:hypothetical protein
MESEINKWSTILGYCPLIYLSHIIRPIFTQAMLVYDPSERITLDEVLR